MSHCTHAGLWEVWISVPNKWEMLQDLRSCWEEEQEGDRHEGFILLPRQHLWGLGGGMGIGELEMGIGELGVEDLGSGDGGVWKWGLGI